MPISESVRVPIEVKVVTLHYRKLNPVCAYLGKDDGCDGEADVVRISALTDGTVAVSTMCEYHSIKEKDHALAEGLKCVGQTSVAGLYSDAMLIDPAVAQEVAEGIGVGSQDG